MEYKKILTQDFITIKIPVLSGKSEKQRALGESIRQKYIDIFNRKWEKEVYRRFFNLFKSSTNMYKYLLD